MRHPPALIYPFLPSPPTQCSILCMLAFTPKPDPRANHVVMYTSQSIFLENKKIIMRKPKDIHSPTRMYTPRPNWIAPFSTLAEAMVGTCCLSLSVLANVDASPHARSQAPSLSPRHFLKSSWRSRKVRKVFLASNQVSPRLFPLFPKPVPQTCPLSPFSPLPKTCPGESLQ